MLLVEESRQYVTINTHLGLFRYTSLPFGVSASPATFKQTMDTILNGLKGVGGILEVLIVTVKKLDGVGVKLKRSKCVFMKPSVEYFAFVVNKNGLYPSPRKIPE